MIEKSIVSIIRYLYFINQYSHIIQQHIYTPIPWQFNNKTLHQCHYNSNLLIGLDHRILSNLNLHTHLPLLLPPSPPTHTHSNITPTSGPFYSSAYCLKHSRDYINTTPIYIISQHTSKNIPIFHQQTHTSTYSWTTHTPHIYSFPYCPRSSPLLPLP